MVPIAVIHMELNWKNIPYKQLKIIQDVYMDAIFGIRSACGDISEFPILEDQRQGSVLSPYFFGHKGCPSGDFVILFYR